MKLRSTIGYFLLALLSIAATHRAPRPGDDHPFALVIHGGAGSISRDQMSAEEEVQYRAALENALEVGYTILANGGTSLDAVETVIRMLEDDSLFNAGKGAVFTNEGTNELDASIMDGRTLNAGAVAAVGIVKNPISAARAIMEKSEHVMLSGVPASEFAREHGLEIVDSEYFYCKKRYEYYLKRKKSLDKQKAEPGDQGGRIPGVEDKYGTVGAVALDQYGNIAAGTSTGGMSNKRYGRIGDSPIIGAGTYADNRTCGVSCTGHGEYFIRLVVAYQIAAAMEYSRMRLSDAVHHIIHHKLEDLGGTGGVIAIDKDGDIVMDFNTTGMFRGYVRADGEKVVELFEK